MTAHQEQLYIFCGKLLTLQRQLHDEIEPQAAHLLCGDDRGEAIIEASENLRNAIVALFRDAQISINK